MVAELFQDADGFQGLAAFAAEEGFDIGRLNEVVVEIELEGRQVAEYDMFVLDWQVFG